MSTTSYITRLQVYITYKLIYYLLLINLLATFCSVSGGKGCLLNGRFSNPPSISTKWWTKQPTLAGETANNAQLRLNSLVTRYQLLYNQFDHIIKVLTHSFLLRLTLTHSLILTYIGTYKCRYKTTR